MSKRQSVKALDGILDKPFKVLDDGFVRVVDYMGGDHSVVRAARVSYGKGTKSVHEDRGLIRYLMRHWHATPFEHATIAMHIRIPMDAWRQFVRHRTLSINEYSTRYSEAIDAAMRTQPDKWRLQSGLNKQGSSGYLLLEDGEFLTQEEAALQNEARRVYESRLAKGVAREQARKDLPLSTYTEAYIEEDLRCMLHLLMLRMDSHAQEEIRAYADVIGNEIISLWAPLTWEAFQDYRLGAVSFSRLEMEMIRYLSHSININIDHLIKKLGWDGKRCRERDEFTEKLENKVGGDILDRWKAALEIIV